MINSRKKGFVLVCKKSGKLDSVIKDDYNIFSDKKNNFYDFFEQEFQYEIRTFLDKIYSYQSPYEDVVSVKEFEHPQNFYLAGAPYDNNAIIVGSTKEDFNHYCWELRQSLSRDLKFLDKLCIQNNGAEAQSPIATDGLQSTADISEIQALQSRLEEKEKALKNKSLELEQFAHIVSHDLKAPLSQSKLIVHLLEKNLSGEHENKEVLKLFNMLVSSTNHMADLIDSIQQYSKSGYLNQQLSNFTLSGLLDEVVNKLTMTRDNILVSYDQDLPIIYANRQKLYQIFYQLISNAIRFHHKESGNIAVKFEELDEFYSFEIIDDGPGIPEEYHQSIFEIFNRTNLRSTKSGSGVGLSIAKKLVEEGGGVLSLDSKVGSGSNFRFIWPKWNGLVPESIS